MPKYIDCRNLAALEPRRIPGLTQHVLPRHDGELIVNELSSEAELPLHSHEEAQFGFALDGVFDLLVNGRERAERISIARGYALSPSVRHGASMRGLAPALSLDVKRRIRGPRTEEFCDISPDPAGNFPRVFACNWLRVQHARRHELEGPIALAGREATLICVTGGLIAAHQGSEDVMLLAPPDAHVIVAEFLSASQ